VTRIGILTISDRVSRGAYTDESGPAIEAWLRRAIRSAWQPLYCIVPDGIEAVSAAMIALCDDQGADLVLATGGTGPAPRDLTPEAMNAVVTRKLPGFGELMRHVSLQTVPTAILSRQSAGIRGRSLIVTLPGKPAAIAVCLDAVFPAIPYCLDLMGAARIETHPEICHAFRPA
jgi:molybdopterin adenylyltransferase